MGLFLFCFGVLFGCCGACISFCVFEAGLQCVDMAMEIEFSLALLYSAHTTARN